VSEDDQSDEGDEDFNKRRLQIMQSMDGTAMSLLAMDGGAGPDTERSSSAP